MSHPLLRAFRHCGARYASSIFGSSHLGPADLIALQMRYLSAIYATRDSHGHSGALHHRGLKHPTPRSRTLPFTQDGYDNWPRFPAPVSKYPSTIPPELPRRLRCFQNTFRTVDRHASPTNAIRGFHPVPTRPDSIRSWDHRPARSATGMPTTHRASWHRIDEQLRHRCPNPSA